MDVLSFSEPAKPPTKQAILPKLNDYIPTLSLEKCDLLPSTSLKSLILCAQGAF